MLTTTLESNWVRLVTHGLNVDEDAYPPREGNSTVLLQKVLKGQGLAGHQCQSFARNLCFAEPGPSSPMGVTLTWWRGLKRDRRCRLL